ncbi:MAG TPA: cupin-like domain-containing protein, partial [Gammaproteobacteria bacterium]
MNHTIPHVSIEENVSAELFREKIFPGGLPVLLRNAVSHWPAVQAAARSPETAAEYIKRFDRGRPVEIIFGRADIGGKFFYNDELSGLNFTKMPERIAATVDRILEARGHTDSPSFYIQSAPIPDYLPGFEGENKLDLVDASIPPRIWIGNRLTVQTHFDVSENIACCVAGRRRFTLFPPDHTPNLYPGPFELTLAG